MPELEVRLSGTVELVRDSRTIELPGRRVWALLVMLALSAGRSVSTDRLASGIWGDDPPANLRASVQTCVARLRGVLGKDLVVTSSAGYTLMLPRVSVDLLRFEDLVEDAAGRDDERLALQQALALWRGEPFGDVRSAWIERHLIPTWTERYLQTFERRIDLDLSAGEQVSCVPELREMIERHPLRETLWARLLTALDRAGRTADALERYEVLRSLLADELGADPSPELQDIHQRLLAAERTPEPAHAPEPEPTRTPRQLPTQVGGFTGRVEQLTALDAAVAAGARVLALHGPGGVGKTSLAVEWAQRAVDLFPDGQLFVDLRGYGPGEPLGSLDALDALLRGLGVPGARIPADEDGRAALLRSELAGRRMLVLLDNARETGQTRPLLPGGDNVAIVTSRSQLRGLVSREGAHRVGVDPMPSDDAIALLRGRLRDSDGKIAANELAELADMCGRLPVALAVAAERAGRDGNIRLDAVNKRLRHEQDRIPALTDWDDDPLTGVRAVFAWSYDVLDADTARMFRLLGFHPDTRISVEAAAALAATDARSAERLLDRLTEYHLLHEPAPGWYELHDLTHGFAAEIAIGSDTDTEGADGVRRLRSWYLHSAYHADDALHPVRVVERTLPKPVAATSPLTFDSDAVALRWFSDHIRTLRLVLQNARDDGDHRTVATLMTCLTAYLRVIGAERETVDLFESAQRSAQATGDAVLEGMVSNRLGNAYTNIGDLDAGLDSLRRARALFASVDNEHGTLMVDINLGVHLGTRGRSEEAIAHYESASEVARDLGQFSQIATLQNNLSTSYLELGRRAEALKAAEDAVRTGRKEKLQPYVRVTHYITLAEAQEAHAYWLEMRETATEATKLCRDAGLTTSEIIALARLGKAERALGRSNDARSSWLHALELFEGIGDNQVADVTAQGLRSLLAELPADPEPENEDS